MTSLSLSTSSAAEIEADAVVVGIASGPDGLVLVPGAQALDAALGGGLLAALTGLGATGRAEEVTRLATLGAVPEPVVVAVGLGPVSESPDPEVVRRATGAGVRALAGSSTSSSCPSGSRRVTRRTRGAASPPRRRTVPASSSSSPAASTARANC